MRIIEGTFATPVGRFAIVAARFNQLIVQKMIEGASDAFRRHGIKEEALDLVWVPGSMEIPVVAKRLAASKQYAAIVTLGVVIKGETGHYDHVAGQSAAGVAQASLATDIPVIFGILTCETFEQALNRAGGKAGNKGFDAAVAAIEMANLLQQIENEK